MTWQFLKCWILRVMNRLLNTKVCGCFEYRKTMDQVTFKNMKNWPGHSFSSSLPTDLKKNIIVEIKFCVCRLHVRHVILCQLNHFGFKMNLHNHFKQVNTATVIPTPGQSEPGSNVYREVIPHSRNLQILILTNRYILMS